MIVIQIILTCIVVGVAFYLGTKFGWNEAETFYRKENRCYDEDCIFRRKVKTP